MGGIRESVTNVFYFLTFFLFPAFSLSFSLFFRLFIFGSNVVPKPAYALPTKISHNDPVNMPR